MPTIRVRTRFAPSPTGNLHLGGLRTALYNYIYAKQNGGQFLLRLEDTDQSRVVPGAADNIENNLKWANLQPDEGPTIGGPFGPYVQSSRLGYYEEHASKLLEAGKAYRCFCSPMRLELLRKNQVANREKPRYDGRCRHLSKTELAEKYQESQGKHVIRFSISPKLTSYHDMIFGHLENDFSTVPESDPIIMKSDKFPTYHFANVVDDHLMQITHVLRGSEWISSTAKHLQLYEAFGWKPPKFAHFPLIVMNDGSKMSKRNNQSQVGAWIESGYRPKAVINFLTNIGGGVPKEKQDANELWDLDKLVSHFNFNAMSCHPGSIDLNRLRIYNSKELRELWASHPGQLISELKDLMRKSGKSSDLDDDELRKTLAMFIDRVETLNDLLIGENAFVWCPPKLTWPIEEYLVKGIDLVGVVSSTISLVEDCSTNLEDKEYFKVKFNEIAPKFDLKYGDYMILLRKLLTNSKSGLPIMEIFACLGRKRLLDYLNNGLVYVKSVNSCDKDE